MKNLVWLCIAGTIISTSVFATPENDIVANLNSKGKPEIKKEKKEERKQARLAKMKEVSDQTMIAFYEDFGDANIFNAIKKDMYDEITFSVDNITYTAFYDSNSKLVGTTTEKQFSDLPENAQRFIEKKYAGYDVKDVIYLDDNEENFNNLIVFGASSSNEDNYFVEMSNSNKSIILRVTLSGSVNYFKDL